MTIQNLFPTGVLLHQVDVDLANKIENLLIPKLEGLEYNGGSFNDYFKENKIITKDDISELIYEIEECKFFYEKQTGWHESYLSNFWVQDYKKDDIHDIHNHGRNELSVVYWVRANKHAGDFIIYNSSPYINLWFGQNESTDYTADFKSIKPQKGTILIFPSFINHKVLPGGKGCIRTTIAFNYSPLRF